MSNRINPGCICCKPNCPAVSCEYLNSIGTELYGSVNWTEVIYELVNFPTTGIIWFKTSAFEWGKFTISDFDQIDGTYTVTRQNSCKPPSLVVDYLVDVDVQIFPLDVVDLGNGYDCPDVDVSPPPLIDSYTNITLRLQFHPYFPSILFGSYRTYHRVWVELVSVPGISSSVSLGYIHHQYNRVSGVPYTDHNECEISQIALNRKLNPSPPYNDNCTSPLGSPVLYGSGSTAETIVA